MRRTLRPKPSAIRRAIDTAGPRANLLSTRRKAEIGPLEVFYTDFTELRFAGGARKAWLIPLLDHRTKYVAGFAVGERANSELALTAWLAARKTLSRYRDSLGGVIVHQDQDSVFTGYAWTGQLLSAGVRLSYALRGPGDNPEMESFFGRFKVENRSLILDAESLTELNTVVRDRIKYYNRVRRHSSLGDRPPLAIIQELYREGLNSTINPEVRCPTFGGSLHNEIREIFPENHRIFKNPKPSTLIGDLLSFATDEDSIVLDSFAGSGTTAHAVLSL